MGLTVRYPNGVVLVFNKANYLCWGDGAWNLYTRRGGEWIASIQPSAGVIIENVPPCGITEPTDARRLRDEIDDLQNRLRAQRVATALARRHNARKL